MTANAAGAWVVSVALRFRCLAAIASRHVRTKIPDMRHATPRINTKTDIASDATARLEIAVGLQLFRVYPAAWRGSRIRRFHELR
jgi:hypothetical protein